MRRRGLLAALGASLGTVAGCTTARPGSAARDSPTAGPGTAAFGDPVSLGDATLTLSRPRVRKAIAEDFGVWQEVRCRDGQYLLLAATTDGDVPTRFGDLDLTSVTGDGTTVDDVSLVIEGRPGEAPRDPSKWDDRRLAHPYPEEPLDRAAIRWQSEDGSAQWELGGTLREQLCLEPRFALRAFEISRDGEDIAIHLRVENAGERDGDFLAQVSFEGVEDDSSLVSFAVPAGETKSFDGVPPILRGLASDGRVVTLAYADGDDVSRLRREL